MRSPLGRARGLGSARDGVAHWWLQRVTAVALAPLTVWFTASLIAHIGGDYASLLA
jgi:succinate dehydrogenase / fumarate reductase membrane anchor subunit